MKALNKYNLDIYRLSNGTHEYIFDIDDSFFQLFESEILNKGKAEAKIILRKTDSLIEATFLIEGTVELECDRSLELFDYPISTKDRILYKYGEEEMEMDDDIYIITKLTQKINVAQHIYDFINMAVPMKKISPKYQDDDDDDSEVKLVYTSGGNYEEDEVDEFTDDELNDEDELDPRWAILKNLKNNSNDN